MIPSKKFLKIYLSANISNLEILLFGQHLSSLLIFYFFTTPKILLSLSLWYCVLLPRLLFSQCIPLLIGEFPSLSNQNMGINHSNCLPYHPRNLLVSCLTKPKNFLPFAPITKQGWKKDHIIIVSECVINSSYLSK